MGNPMKVASFHPNVRSSGLDAGQSRRQTMIKVAARGFLNQRVSTVSNMKKTKLLHVQSFQ